ncbi:MAG: hypothetical protein PHP86_16945 [Nevskiales bacterium]|nr:hypothetical protein [Nevskiales bacterium]
MNKDQFSADAASALPRLRSVLKLLAASVLLLLICVAVADVAALPRAALRLVHWLYRS